jgi:hypothetical protein
MQIDKLVLPNTDGFHAIELRLKAESFRSDDAGELFGSHEACEQVDAFCKRTGLPLASIVVAAAGAWRCYWLLERPVKASEWRGLQDALAIAAEMVHLPADIPRSATDQLDLPKGMVPIRPPNGTTPPRRTAGKLLTILEKYVSSAVLIFPKRACVTAA